MALEYPGLTPKDPSNFKRTFYPMFEERRKNLKK